ncbi:MAG TPA: ferritin-like domain-containing protein [Actinophytocola sp.]|uniref:ferritin-like domain-containing protein n=1 Tax=Actinophytocola sp. TaxID=1872138 RepID=UPI002DDDA11E|nr:ferritin-like domain-containing protein [Actinophytocola sp.]HEV2782496.1 ferritin-like domain-containing protein [Actinophytocola sp.]
MSTDELYILPSAQDWTIGAAGTTRFDWDYADGREKLLALYQKGKDKQWDAEKRIDWDIEVDPYDALGLPDETIAIHGTRYWDAMSEREHAELRRHICSWQFSQFLHGEQGAMITAARIVETVPDLDAKFYSATQTMDEARHAELYSRFLREKIGMLYPINDQLQALLKDTLTDSRWDMPYLGMQVLIEGLALAAFGLLRDMTTKPLPKQLLAYVMQDEARHVAFGRLTLRDYYKQLTDAERREREDFVIEGCYLMRDRIRGYEIWQNFGIDHKEIKPLVDQAPYLQAFRKLLFSRIVPCVRDIGLWGERLQRAYVDMGVLEMGDASLDRLMRQDEDIAEAVDAERFRAEEEARKAEVHEAIALGAAD